MVSDADTQKIMSLLALVIVLKFYVTIIKSGISGNIRPPEDKKTEATVDENTPIKASQQQQQLPVADFDSKERWRRIGLNELENVPIALALMVYSVFAPNTNNEVNIAMASIFLFGRIMHSVLHTLLYLFNFVYIRYIWYIMTNSGLLCVPVTTMAIDGMDVRSDCYIGICRQHYLWHI